MANLQQAQSTILGIDPGYERLGWAIAQQQGSGLKQIDLGCIETNKDQDLFERYLAMEQKLQKIIDQYHPDQAAIETLFFCNNVTTAMKVAESRGILIACLMKNNLRISQYNPMQIKETTTGNGRADKKAVEKMIRMEFNLRNKKVLDDAIDALAVILTHSIQSKNRKYYA